MSLRERSNAYRSSNSVIVSGPGTMYNEVTRQRSYTKQYNENTNTHDVTVPYIKTYSGTSTKTRTSKSKNSKKANK